MVKIEISYLTVASHSITREMSARRAKQILRMSDEEKARFIEQEANKEPMGYSPYRAEGLEAADHARIKLV